MVYKLTMVLFIVSTVAYSMDTDLVIWHTKHGHSCPKKNYSKVSSSYAHNQGGGCLTSYVRKACYGILPSLTVCADVPLPMPSSINFTSAITEYNITTEYILYGAIGGLVILSGCTGFLGWMYQQKKGTNQYKAIEVEQSNLEQDMESNLDD